MASVPEHTGYPEQATETQLKRVVIESRERSTVEDHHSEPRWTSKMLTRRALATVIDWFLGLLIAVFIGWVGSLVGIWSNVDGSSSTVIDQTLLLFSVIGLSVGFQARLGHWGQTIGKQITGIRVEGIDDMSLFAVRELIKYIVLSLVILQGSLTLLLLIYVASYIVAWKKPGLSLHDSLLKTHVVRASAPQES